MRATVALLLLSTALLTGCSQRREGAWNPAGRPATATRQLVERDLVPTSRAGSGSSAFAVWGVSGLPLFTMLALAAAMFVVHRRRARAERAVKGEGPIWDGPLRIEGVVEVDPALPGPPVVVHVHQRGTEARGKNGWSHRWSEVSRDVLVRPFSVRRADGLVVRVEPDARPLVQADLAQEARHARDSRTRSLEIRPGTRVQVAGVLTGSVPAHPEAVYRAAGTSLVLRPPRGGRMVISAEPPGDLPAGRARFHLRWAVALLVSMALLGGTALRDYLILTVDGTPLIATATQSHTWDEYVKPKNRAGYWVPHYSIRARAAVGGEVVTVEDEVRVTTYDCVRAGTCLSVPFLVARHSPGVHQVGSAPTLSDGIIVLLVIVSAVLVIVYAAMAASTRRWYVRSKVVDTGAGQLG